MIWRAPLAPRLLIRIVLLSSKSRIFLLILSWNRILPPKLIRNIHQQKYPVHQVQFLNATQSLDPLVLVKKSQVAENLMQLLLQSKSNCQLVETWKRVEDDLLMEIRARLHKRDGYNSKYISMLRQKFTSFIYLFYNFCFIVWVWFSTVAVKTQEFCMKVLNTFYASANFFTCLKQKIICAPAIAMNIPLFFIIFCIRLILRGDIHLCLYAFVSPGRLLWNVCRWYSLSYALQLSYPTEWSVTQKMVNTSWAYIPVKYFSNDTLWFRPVNHNAEAGIFFKSVSAF